jgi:MFS family permease
MYSDNELDAAVAAGVVSAQDITALRDFIRKSRTSPDEEQFRLLSGFNDIFISIAIAVFLIAACWLGGKVAPMFGGAVAVAASWLLAEYFTRRRRLALPSIVLAIGYGIGAARVLTVLLQDNNIAAGGWFDQSGAALGFFMFLFGLIFLAYYVHWRRFQVPITVTFCALAGLGLVFTPLGAIYVAVCGHFNHGARPDFAPLFLVIGLTLFGVAMWWDMSDRQRQTRRTDVAFWLHLCAAPIIVHSLFAILGVFSPSPDAAGRALVVVGCYVLMTIAALIIDRRALLTAALAYVLYAIGALIRMADAPDVSFALAGLVIGGALLLLSAFWHQARRLVLRALPAGVQRYVPAA